MSDDIQEGWWKHARVGQKVVCVRLPNRTKSGKTPTPMELGKQYIIRAIKTDDWAPTGVVINVGITNKQGGSVFTSARCFRPLVTKSTDAQVAELKKLLNTAPVHERA